MMDDGYGSGLTAKSGFHEIGVVKDRSRGLARPGGTKNGGRTRPGISSTRTYRESLGLLG